MMRKFNYKDCVVLAYYVYVAALVLCAILFTSCKAQTQVITEYRERVVHDTTMHVDSVWRDRWHIEYLRGDTIYLHDSVFLYKYKYLDRIKEVQVHDSVPYPVEVIQYVRKRNGYDKFTSCGFWVLAALLLLYVAWRIIKAYYLRR